MKSKRIGNNWVVTFRNEKNLEVAVYSKSLNLALNMAFIAKSGK